MVEDGVPAYRLTNTCLEGRYRIEKTVLTDPERDVVLQHIRFVPLVGELSDYRLYRPAGAAPGQPRRGQHRLGRRLQGHAHAVLFAQGRGRRR